MQAVIPIMREAGGTIINISSVAGHIPLPYGAAYSASKFALNAIGKAAPPGIVTRQHPRAHGVSGICGHRLRPEYDYGPHRQYTSRSVRGITAKRVARAVYQGYIKRKREVIVPWTMHPVVKLYQLFPGLVEWGMMKVMPRPAGTVE